MLKIKPKYLQRLLRSTPNVLWLLKYYVIKKSIKSVGYNFRFSPDSVFDDHRIIEIGDNVFMGQRTTISTNVPLKIGHNVMFGPEVMIMGGDHNFKKPGEIMRNVKSGGTNLPVEIENDVWIGARCLILKGVKIYEGAVVGAGSLVTKPVLPYSINIGHPSHFVKCRFSLKELTYHLQKVNSKYKIDDIIKMYSLSNIDLS